MLAQWLSQVFSGPDLLGALTIAGKTTVIYIAMILGLRLLGKRELGQLSIYDLVLIIVISNSVQNAMVGRDTTLLGGLIAALTLLILNRVFTWFMVRSDRIRNWMEGEPTLIVRDGKLIKNQMQREGVTTAHVLAAMREHGIGQLDQVQMAVLEVDGSISIVPKEAQVHRTRHRLKGMRVQ